MSAPRNGRTLSVTCKLCGTTTETTGAAETAMAMLARCDQAHDLLHPECQATKQRAMRTEVTP